MVREKVVEVGRGWMEMNVKEPGKSEDCYNKDGRQKLMKLNPGQ